MFRAYGQKTIVFLINLIFLTETWLLPRICNAELFNDSFVVFRQDRSALNSEKRSGGGVLMAVKAKYDCDIVEIQGTQNIECIAVKVALPESPLCAYMPPRDTIDKFESHMRPLSFYLVC